MFMKDSKYSSWSCICDQFGQYNQGPCSTNKGLPRPKGSSLPQGWDLLWISLERGWQGNVRALEDEVLFSLG